MKVQWRRNRGGGKGGGGGGGVIQCSHDISLVRHGTEQRTVRLLIIWDCVAAVTIASYN